MRKVKKLGSLLVAAAVALTGMISFPSDAVFADDASTTYSYTYDIWGEMQSSPDAYRATKQLSGDMFEFEDEEGNVVCKNFNEPQGQFIRGNKIFVCDTGNNRIVEIAFDGKQYNAVRQITAIKGLDEENATLNKPYDIYVTEDYEMIIADYGNERVLHVDKDLNLIKMLTKPDVTPFNDEKDARAFQPQKLIMDTAGRIYVQAEKINKGLMEYDTAGEFTQYVGASPVSFNMIDYIWRFFMTEEQIRRQEKFVPTEYNNVAIDSEGFMYVTMSTFDDNEYMTANSVRRLNSTGSDILIRNGNDPPCGDLKWDNAGGYNGPSRFYDVVTFENNSYCCIDQTRGRIFAYDFQGNLLYAFGGIGNRLGYFRKPVAIERMGETLFVLDGQYSNITVFEITDFGKLINKALREYQNADYDKSAEYWEEVLRLNGNYDLAYIGVGRALLRQEKYHDAMEYFKAKRDRRNYSKAYEQYRKEQIEEYIGDLVKALVIVLVGIWLIKKVRKIQKEVRECD